EGPGQLQVLLLAAAGGEKALAADFSGRQAGFASGLPLDADGFDAEIVLSADLEGERLAVEHDFLPRKALTGQARRLIFAGIDGNRERSGAGETVFVLP